MESTKIIEYMDEIFSGRDSQQYLQGPINTQLLRLQDKMSHHVLRKSVQLTDIIPSILMHLLSAVMIH